MTMMTKTVGTGWGSIKCSNRFLCSSQIMSNWYAMVLFLFTCQLLQRYGHLYPRLPAADHQAQWTLASSSPQLITLASRRLQAIPILYFSIETSTL